MCKRDKNKNRDGDKTSIKIATCEELEIKHHLDTRKNWGDEKTCDRNGSWSNSTIWIIDKQNISAMIQMEPLYN